MIGRMLVALDVGNTNTTLGVFDVHELCAQWRLSTSREQTVDEYGILTRNLFSLAGLDAAEVDWRAEAELLEEARDLALRRGVVAAHEGVGEALAHLRPGHRRRVHRVEGLDHLGRGQPALDALAKGVREADEEAGHLAAVELEGVRHIEEDLAVEPGVARGVDDVHRR